MVVLILVAVFAALLAALLFWPFHIRVGVHFVFRREDWLRVNVSMLGGMIKKGWTLSVADLPGGWYGVWLTDRKGRRYLVTHLPRVKQLSRLGTRRTLAGVLRRTRIDVLELKSELGLGSDAAATALAAGALRALTAALLTAFYPPGSISGERVKIRPRFDRACFIFLGRCIITFRIEHIIIAGWNNLMNKRKKAVIDAGASH